MNTHPQPLPAKSKPSTSRLSWWRRVRIFFLEKEVAILRDERYRYEMAEAIGPIYQFTSYEQELRLMARIRALKGLPPLPVHSMDATNTPPQSPQQVLKAEATSPPDATDRGAAASASPCVGTMGAGQPADAGPAVGPRRCAA